MPTPTVFEVLRMLTPWDVDIPKVRIGGAADGGYILVDRFHTGQAVLSFGIGNETSFDHDMATRGHPVFMFDHTIKHWPPEHPNFRFIREGLFEAERREGTTLAGHLARQGVAGSGHILKLDIEGAEWGALAATTPETLALFEQITLEVHELQQLAEEPFRAAAAGIFAALNRRFTLFHVHANNTRRLATVEGLPVTEVLELSYVRTDLVTRRPSATLYPTALDQANVGGAPDILLWFFPFLPAIVSPAQMASDAALVRARYELAGARARGSKERRRANEQIAALQAELQQRTGSTAAGIAAAVPSGSSAPSAGPS